MRARSVWRCLQCGFASPKPGTCPDCKRAGGELTILVEEREAPPSARRTGAPPSRPRPLGEVSMERAARVSTAIGELDRVLGGGVVPGSLVLIGGDPGIGKCVTADTRVLDPRTGDYVPITRWHSESRPVLAVDERTLRLWPTTVTAFHRRGLRGIVQVETRLGRRLRCTPDHPVLTPHGWHPITDLAPGSRIAAPRALPYFGSEALPEPAVKLLAYILSDGSAQSAVTVTNELPEVAEDLEEIAATFGTERVGFLRESWARLAGVSPFLLNQWQRNCAPRLEPFERLAAAAGVTPAELGGTYLSATEARTPIARFLETHGLRYARTRTKSVPAAVFRLPRKELALFLRTLFTCDGSVYVNRRGQAGVSYATASRRLAEDVQHLLLRFGFVARLRTKTASVNDRAYLSYEVVLLGHPDVRRFLLEIGIRGRAAAGRQILGAQAPRGHSALRREAGVAIRNRRQNRPLTRVTVRALARALADERLLALTDGDVYWDEILSITDAGEEQVYDVSVPQGESFVANDLLLHNSTLLLQAARALAERMPPVLYVSGEESAAQVKMRADRLGLTGEGLLLWTENDLSLVQAELDTVKPRALVVDSIQTVFLPDLESAPGSVAQVRECGGRLMTLAKGRGMATFLVGHVTKEGALAGPRVLEHLVDTVLYFEGEPHHAYRVLRAVKNRFGSTNEIGVFQMAEHGLLEVGNPSGFFLAERPRDAPGSVIVPALEGTRPLLVELQALVASASFGTPRRTVLGLDYNRVCLLLAVLEKRAGVPLGTQDVFVNVAGGGRVVEPAADLGVMIAAASSYLDRPVRGDVVVVGEVGLTGEVRAVTGLEARLREAAQLGFREAVVPQSNLAERPRLPLETHGVATVPAAMDALLG